MESFFFEKLLSVLLAMKTLWIFETKIVPEKE